MARQGDGKKGSKSNRGEGTPAEFPVLPRNFIVAIAGVEIGFASLSRLASETVSEGPTGDRGAPARDVHRHPNVVLRRALGSDRRLYQWRENIVAGKADRRQVIIRQLNSAGRETLASWSLEGAWPCRWAGPAFDAAATDVAMEEIELAFDRLVWR